MLYSTGAQLGTHQFITFVLCTEVILGTHIPRNYFTLLKSNLDSLSHLHYTYVACRGVHLGTPLLLSSAHLSFFPISSVRNVRHVRCNLVLSSSHLNLILSTNRPVAVHFAGKIATFALFQGSKL
jgi:hypothetical protein